jgi:hypothetical protein
MNALAREKGGLCLSSQYINNRTKLKWQCKEGHVWESRPSDIQSGYWCRKCGLVLAANKRRASIEDMKELARKKGGNCISENYINSQTKLKWQCKEDHVWEAKPNCISRGQWCPYCSKNVKLTIEKMQSLAQERGGECLSNEYINI